MRLAAPLAIVAAGILAYANSLAVPFLFDDEIAVLDNPSIRHLWPPWQALFAPPWTILAGRPAANLSMAVNYALGGLDPWGYHALNLAVHLCATLALLGLVRLTLAGPRLAPRFGAAAPSLALAAALLWTVHPLQSEAVTYVTQRTELLGGLFYLLTVYTAARGSESARPRAWSLASVAACALGIASKEVVVSAPLMVVLYDRLFVDPSLAAALRRRWALYAGLAGTWALLAVLLVVNPQHAATGFQLGHHSLAYAATQVGVLARYLRLAVWPAPLCFDYGMWTWAAPPDVLPAALVVAALAAGTAWALARAAPVGFLGAWFFLILAPSSSVVPIVTEFMAERRMYLPLAAVVVLGVTGAHALGTRLRGGRGLGAAGAALTLALVATGAALTLRRNHDYRSTLAIWSDTVAKRPDNARARNYLGNVLLAQGLTDDAIAQYAEAVRLRPEYAKAHFNLAVALARRGDLAAAATHYAAALAIEPDDLEARTRLGAVLVKLGHVDDAITQYSETLRIAPGLVGVRLDLGSLLLGQGRVDDAIAQYRLALQAAPNSPEAHYALGNALLDAHRVDDAVAQYAEALRLRPDWAKAHNNLGSALLEQGKVEQAVTHYDEALRLDPGATDVRDNLELAREALRKAGRAP